MTRQFNRIASVKIGVDGSKGGVDIRENRITFNVKKVADKTKNKATIRIHNLSKTTRNKLDEVDELLILEAGYSQGDGLKTMFTGNIISVNHILSQPEVVTVIQASDGHVSERDTNLSLSFAAGTKAEIIFDKIVSTLKLPFTKTKELFGKEEFANAFAFAGPVGDVLTKVSDKLGLDWSIQNNELKVVKKGQADNDLPSLLTPASGLIGSPQKVDDIRKGKKKGSKQPGWRITSLLLPTLEAGGRVSVRSKEIPDETEFKVETVSHVGDNHGDDWNSTIVVSEIK